MQLTGQSRKPLDQIRKGSLKFNLITESRLTNQPSINQPCLIMSGTVVQMHSERTRFLCGFRAPYECYGSSFVEIDFSNSSSKIITFSHRGIKNRLLPRAGITVKKFNFQKSRMGMLTKMKKPPHFGTPAVVTPPGPASGCFSTVNIT